MLTGDFNKGSEKKNGSRPPSLTEVSSAVPRQETAGEWVALVLASSDCQALNRNGRPVSTGASM